MLPALPETLSVVGDDYIALELATLFARLGVKIKLYSPGEQVLAGLGPLEHWEPAALRLVQAGLRKLGIQVTTKAAIEEVNDRPIVISQGVCPNTSELHLDAAGVEMTPNNGIAVNSMQQSSMPHIYAVGDCTGERALASIAIKQAKVAAEVLSGQRVQFAPLVTPQIVHTTPEIASVGYTAE